MKIIEVDEELYQYIAGKTQSIGESASDILRRLLNLPALTVAQLEWNDVNENGAKKSAVKNDNLLSSPSEQRELESLSDSKNQNTLAKSVKKQSEDAINHIVEKVRALLNSESFQEETKAVGRFLAILRILYRTNPESFAQATESLQGRTRVYFARDEGTLLIAGNHTKPKQIPDTPYWVITNTNSGRKMLMLESAMQSMQLPDSLIDEVRSYFVAN
ncbi:replication initiation negative regulator SeqA [Rodentibacter caecimuris]|uniref:Negative modulator of initiation of replication n=1 Tax=Rodentibacter caecimuris TaxID=1796644 RepID=A0ABX3KWC9_9PAST|nr:replication initiation regulator SeqA [Rodentibacter heylii]